MKIWVMGSGAIGSVFGGFLAAAGHRVTLVGRAGHMDAIQKQGLRISGIWGEHRVRNLETRTSLPDSDRAELILFTVKSYQTREAIQEVVRALPDPPTVLSLQNGLGNLETIADVAGRDRTLGGRVIFGAEIKEPGHVAVTVYADRVAIGPPQGSRFPERLVQEIARLIDEAGIPCFATREIEPYIWGKVLYNAALNAPAALLEINYGKLLEHNATQELMHGIIREAFAVAHASGVALDWNTPEEYAETLFRDLIPATASHFPSMLQDIHRGKRTEIDALNGALVRLGKAQGIPTPINETLTRLIQFKTAS